MQRNTYVRYVKNILVPVKKLTRHSKCCSDKTKHIFPGGFYEIKKTIFDELKEIDIIVNEQDKFFLGL